MIQRIVVVGASLAGLRAAETLRAHGFDGTITLVGDEPHRPYDRPPLSKQVLQGTREPEDAFFRRKDGYDALALDMRLGTPATSLDLRARRITLGGGPPEGGPYIGGPYVLDYDRLIIATGARVRTLPATAPRGGLHLLRGLDDALALRADLATATHVAIVGAGFIGLEVAASCRARGLNVTAIEALPVPLAPIIGAELGGMVAAMHRDHGVDLRTGVTVAEVTGESRVSGVVLSDGSRIDADVVVVGVGVTPNTEWLAESGLTLDNGIVCDGYGEAAPNVYAAGDVARMHNAWFDESVRVEHWTNAVEQGVHVAANVLAGTGARTIFSSVPYFWSDQYDRKIQFIGRARPGDEMEIVDGSLTERRLTAVYRRDNRLVACLALNQPRAVSTYRKLLENDPERAASSG
jgi:NADPH-dependent 2,4-dienoyl-CoA reductase/sulfur reductase-like enzyme